MLHELTALRPAALVEAAPALALVIAALGVGFWAVGGRFSRSILTLALVAVGAWVGMRLPRWFGWEIDGMGLGMAGAMFLGVAGYLLHRTCVGVLLGGVIATWAGFAAWVAVAAGVQWTLPRVTWTANLPEMLRQVWQSLPPEVARVVPLTTVGGLAAGVVMALVWPKLSRILAFDLLGVLLMAAVGVPLVAAQAPQWLTYLPSGPEQQVFAVIVLVGVGLAVQWKLTPGGPKKAVIPASVLRDAPRVVAHDPAAAASGAPRPSSRPGPRRFVQLQEVLA